MRSKNIEHRNPGRGFFYAAQIVQKEDGLSGVLAGELLEDDPEIVEGGA